MLAAPTLAPAIHMRYGRNSALDIIGAILFDFAETFPEDNRRDG
jgi:hypothetical protein